MTSRLLLPTAALTLLLAACGGSSAPPTSDATSPSIAVSETPTPTTAPRPGGSAAANTSGAAVATTDPSTAVAAASAAGTTGTTGDTGDDGTAPAFTAAGDYTYQSKGTFSAGGTPRDASGTTTLTVDAPSGGQQHTKLGGEDGGTEQYLVVRPDGTYLARLVIKNAAFTKDFRPAKPVLVMPSPATAGKSWSWTATSTDGKTTVAATAKIGGKETLTIGGQSTPTTILDSTLRISGDVDYSTTMKSWYDEAHRLSVKEHTNGKGSFNGVQFTTDITSVLRSTTPS